MIVFFVVYFFLTAECTLILHMMAEELHLKQSDLRDCDYHKLEVRGANCCELLAVEPKDCGS